MNPSIVELVHVARGVDWLPWAVQYSLLIGLSVGAFLLALPGFVFKRPAWQDASRIALLGSIVCGLAAPVALLSDLHQPGRFFNFYTNPNPASWMAYGAFFIPFYLGSLLLFAWLGLRPDFLELAEHGGHLAPMYRRLALDGNRSFRGINAAALLTLVGASLIVLYTGMEVMVVRARPLWNTPLLPVQFFVSALGGAVGLLLVLGRVMRPTEFPTRVLNRLLAGTQILALAVGAIWLGIGLSGVSHAHTLALVQIASLRAWWITGVWAAGSAALTCWLALRRPENGLLTGLLALHSAWMMRWTVFIDWQTLRKTGAGAYSYNLPLGPDGLLGIAGTAALWLFLFLLLTNVFPWAGTCNGNAPAKFLSSERRKFVVSGSLAVFAAGFSQTAGRIFERLLGKDKPNSRFYGSSLAPEFRIDPGTGKIDANPAQQVSYTMCSGCVTFCGVRVRIDKATGRVVRVSGNPYSPLSTDPHLPMKASVRDSFQAISRYEEKGLAGRSTTCGRGNAVFKQLDSPFRVLSPLKRVGARNSGQWQPISFEQLLAEVSEGGDLFNEGHVDGLRALRDLATPIDPDRPELGPRVNQVAVLNNTNEGREGLVRRFFQQAYGTLNFVGHGAYCGGAYRSGSGALFGDLKKMPHGKPDFGNAEFCLFIGTAPSQAGNPFKRQSMLVSKARTEGKLSYVVVDPVLTNAENMAAGDRNRWLAIKPGTDGAFVMGMILWLLENERYDFNYLAQPNETLAQAAGEPSRSNATHLVVVESGHPRESHFLRGSDLGFSLAEEDRYKETDPFVVLNVSGRPIFHHKATGPAALFVDTTVKVGGADVRVKSSLQLLKEEASRYSLEEYASICGIPAESIAGLAEEFSSHGKRAAAIAHGGMMTGNGFYNAYAVMMLNALIGNLNWKGGLVMNGGPFKDDGEGPRYNLESFAGMAKPSGIPLGRNVAYEKTSEFAWKKAAGKPYPADAPWFPNAAGLGNEWLIGALNGYPYRIKALVLWSSNPLYGVPGLRAQVEQDLADPKKLPLIVSIDPFINESNAFADYIVPDSLLYESWGWATPWSGVPSKTSTARWPVVEPKAQKLSDGQAIGVETFLIALAKRLGLAGFGPGAITDAEGNTFPLERPEHWYLRGGANIAWLGKEPVPDATSEDMALSGVDRLLPILQASLKAEEIAKVAFLLTRGGRYQPAKDVYDEENPEWMANRFHGCLQIWNEQVGASQNSLSGKRNPGSPAWTPPAFADGTPMRRVYSEDKWPLQLVSYKSVLQNSYSIAVQRLREIHPENPVLVHPRDAARFGLSNGNNAELRTPGGSVKCRVIVHEGIMPGVIAIEHGFGHRELGARAHRFGTVKQTEIVGIGAGVCLNDLGLPDPTRRGLSIWTDPVCGSSVRNGLPATISRG
jgi:tetrathionate reductase subunit A